MSGNCEQGLFHRWVHMDTSKGTLPKERTVGTPPTSYYRTDRFYCQNCRMIITDKRESPAPAPDWY